MADEDEEKEVGAFLDKFKNFSDASKNFFMEKCITLCKDSQLQSLYEDIERILAKDFVALMPAELSEKIFLFLDVTSLCRAAQVNKRWRKISESNKIWYMHCHHQNWVSFNNEKSIFDAPKVVRSNRPSSARKACSSNSTLPYEFKKLTKESFETSEDFNAWKELYIRVHHLENNWADGYYVVKPILRGHIQPVTCLDCNDEIIASGSFDKTVRLWDLSTCRCLTVLSQFSDGVKCLKLQNDVLVTGCSNGLIFVHDLKNDFSLTRILVGHIGSVDHICCEGDRIVSASSTERAVRIWSIKDGNCLNCLSGHTDDIEVMKLRGNILVTASWDESVRVWNIEEGTCIQSLRGHTEVVLCVQFDDQKVITGGADGLVITWDIFGHLTQTLHGHSAEVYCLEFNDEIIASGSADSTIKIWSIHGKLLYTLEGHIGIVRCLNLWNTRLISGGDCKKVIVWDTKTGQLLNAVHRHPTSLHLMWTNRTKLVTASPETPGTITVISYW